MGTTEKRYAGTGYFVSRYEHHRFGWKHQQTLIVWHEKKDKKKQRITVEVLHKLHESLNKLSVERTNGKYQLKPDRADVIVPAGNIFLTIADIIHATHIYVPVIGLADGIIDGLYASHLEEKQKILGILPSKKDVSGTPEDAEE